MAAWNPTANEIFLAAREITSAGARELYLQQACGDNAALREQVETLLMADVADSFLERPAAELGVTTALEPTAAHAARISPAQKHDAIGPYVLLEMLGEGGMGEVWLAEQRRPIQRRVALKIIKSGLNSAQVLARFEQERQALAMMDHPHIAKVLDAGTTPSGRPYFVMELIKGVPITRFCDVQNIPLQERLPLFAQVCDAVQHAHQKGIIHRDLKPSNVLVALKDGEPTVKVIDFGVAKATEQKLTERTLHTEFGSIIGTFEYMSPEQAELSNLDIDTRADIYSLGVMLYELLAGSTPFPANELRSAAFTEMLRMIREVDPPKPSTRVMTAQTRASIAAQRRIEPVRLTNYLRGDLDWIVMKCLDKDRRRRYESANALAEDLRRFLSDEPVAAGPPSAGYRLRKFVRRNRQMVITAGVLLLVLMGGLVGTTWGFLRARAAERLAVDRFNALQKSEQATRKALADSEQARALEKSTSEFLTHAFSRADPGVEGKDVTVRAVLDATASSLNEFQGSPQLKAGIQHQLGLSYIALGMPDRAEKYFRQAYEARRELLGLNHRDTLYSFFNIGASLDRLGLAQQALDVDQEAYDRLAATYGKNDPQTLSAAYNLSGSYFQLGRREEAIKLNEETFAGMRETLGVDDERTISCLSGLAFKLLHQDKQKALELVLEADERARRVLGPLHQSSVLNRIQVAANLGALGRAPEAVELLKTAVKEVEAGYGSDHLYTISTMRALSTALRDSGRMPEAIPIAKQAADRALARYGPDSDVTSRIGSAVGLLYRAQNENTLALPYLERAVAYYERHLDRIQIDGMRVELNVCYRETGQYEKAIPIWYRVIEDRTARLGIAHRETRFVVHDCARDLNLLGRFEEAERLLTEQVKLTKGQLPTIGLEGDQLLLLAFALSRQQKLSAAHQCREQLRALHWVEHENYARNALEAIEAVEALEQQKGDVAQLQANYEGLTKHVNNRPRWQRWPERFCLEALLQHAKQEDPSQREAWQERLKALQ